MARARSNYAPSKVDAKLAPDATESELRRGYREYQTWHWFPEGHAKAPPVRVVDWQEPDMPRRIIECGRMARLHIRPVFDPRHPRRQRDRMIQFPLSVTRNSHIGFDPDHPHQRLYLLVDPQSRAVLKANFWDQNTIEPMALADVAQLIGGRHARGNYPKIRVKPIGPLTGVVYFTLKKGDGRSYYLHKQGELTGGFPALCISEDGRLWVAGGSYTAPTPGIAD